MRRALHILLTIAVLVCSLHLGEDAHAHETDELHQLEQVAPAADPNNDPGDSHDGTGKVAHSGHHHCPIAGDQDAVSALGIAFGESSLPSARPVAALASLSRAPPLQPPSA